MATPPSQNAPLAPTPEELDRAVTVWGRVVGTQEHFNDMCMRVRTLYATLIGALIAAYGFLIDKSKGSLTVAGFTMDAIIPIALAGVWLAAMFYFVDRYWYHALLKGAVDQGAEIETRWAAHIPEIRMGSKISTRSAVDLGGKPLKYLFARLLIADTRLKTTRKLHSDAKIEIFYKPIMMFMLLIAAFSTLTGGIKIDGKSVIQTVRSAVSS